MALTRGKKSSRRAVVLVEFALVLPLLVLLTFGVMEYGWMFLKAQEINNVSRDAVRLAVLPDATNADVDSRIAAMMTAAGLGGSGYTMTYSPANVANAAPETPVSVTISVPYDDIDLFGLPILPTPATLQFAVTMAKEGI